MDTGTKPRPVTIKKEPGLFIKSEFQPGLTSLPIAPRKKERGVTVKSEFGRSLSSLPLAPASIVKEEFGPEKKPALGAPPSQRDQKRRSRHGRFRSFITHQVNGHHIRAHYNSAQSKVEFTVRKNGPRNPPLDWMGVERAVFQKLHDAHFDIEPIERPGRLLQDYCQSTSNNLRFDVQTRPLRSQTQAPPKPVAAPAFGTHGMLQASLTKDVPKAESISDVPFGLTALTGIKTGDLGVSLTSPTDTKGSQSGF